MHLLKFEAAEVRMFEIDGALWWVASDVATVLGYRDAEGMTRWLDDDERGTHNVSTSSADQQMTIISESGLYQAIFRSRREEAKAFRRWVTTQVLPSIRIHGQYPPPQIAPTLPEPEIPPTQHGRFIQEVEAYCTRKSYPLDRVLKGFQFLKASGHCLA